MKTKNKAGRTAALFLVAVIALAGAGISYAHWSQTLTVSGSVETGELDWVIVAYSIEDTFEPPIPVMDWNCRDGFAGPPPLKWQVDKNVGWADGELTEDLHILELSLHNVYPSYFNAITVSAQNTGTIPLIIEKVIISSDYQYHEIPDNEKVELDLNGDEKGDIEFWWKNSIGQQVDPEDYSSDMTCWMHVLQDAPQGEILSFTIEIVAVQWNEYVAP